MDVEQEFFDPNKEIIMKMEPDLVSDQIDGHYLGDTKDKTFKNDRDCVLGDTDNICGYQTTRGLGNFDQIKQECELPKIEGFDLPQNIEYESVRDIVYNFPNIIKKERENTIEVKATAIDDIKPVVSEISEYVHFKDESELLTSHCDLPTLKSEVEVTDYQNYFAQPSSSKETVVKLKSSKHNVRNVPKQKKRGYLWSVLQNNFRSSKSRLKRIDGHFGKDFVVCEFCGRFMTKLIFFRHHFIHVVKNKLKKVSLEIHDVSSLRVHKIIHSNKKPFNCDICSKAFNQKISLRSHLINHTNEKPFKCNICLKEFNKKSNLRAHLIIHSNEKSFKCDICSKGFNNKSYLRKHLIIHSNEKSFKCDLCPKGYNQKFNLKRHLIIHSNEKPFKCDICFKKFNYKSSLQTHLLIHSDKKPFKCNICSKGFNNKSNLQQHLIIHNNDKPFKCDICSKGFNDKSSLQKHLLIHSKEKPFKCDICSKGFNQKFNLQKHLIIHSNEKSFKCDICSKEFNDKYSLRRHLIIHTNEKPFKCDICSKEFNRKSSLQKHLIIHSDICSKRFDHKSSLR